MTPSEPVYRQDEFVRVPGAWTKILQTVLAVFFAIQAVAGIAITLLLRAEIRDIAVRQIEKQQPSLSTDQVRQATDIGLAVAIVFAFVFGVLYLLIALGSYYRKWTWLWWVIIVVLGLGTIGWVVGLATGSAFSTSTVYTGYSVVVGGITAALFAWTIVAQLRYGVWGQVKAPVALET